MIKRQGNILLVTIAAVTFVALSVFLWFSTEKMLSMSEVELFENLVARHRIFEDFHPSVATFLTVMSLAALWIIWAVYLICCIIISVRWFKERKK